GAVGGGRVRDRRREPRGVGGAAALRPGGTRARAGGAIAVLVLADRSTIAVIFAVVVIGHYLISYDRIQWMLNR
ncbi:MAG: hypothetical protein L0154_03255, partial [Chloroflexi bacterium]|nr:hypothetical protein [Chloroflexota bacterium]